MEVIGAFFLQKITIEVKHSDGFIGYAPFVSGTVGTVAAVPCFWLFDDVRSVSTALYVLSFLLLVAGACWIAGRAEQLLQEHDSGRIVIDEIVGYLVTMAGAPFGPAWILAGFALFRLFDVVKPWPIGALDRHLSGGIGIMADDVLAGIFSLALLQRGAFAMAGS